MAEHTNKNEHGDHYRHTVTILVDGVKHEVQPGSWIVSELKEAVDVPAAKVLAKVTPQGLDDLDDAAKIEVHEAERFVSHVRSGGSS